MIFRTTVFQLSNFREIRVRVLHVRIVTCRWRESCKKAGKKNQQGVQEAIFGYVQIERPKGLQDPGFQNSLRENTK